jgi:hypothetical protein
MGRGPNHIRVSLSKVRSAPWIHFFHRFWRIRTDLKRYRSDRDRGDLAIVTLAPRAKNVVGVTNSAGIADSPLQDHRLLLPRLDTDALMRAVVRSEDDCSEIAM